jgi:hypothetical protein
MVSILPFFYKLGDFDNISSAFFPLGRMRIRIGRRGWNRQVDSGIIKIKEYPRCLGFMAKRWKQVV